MQIGLALGGGGVRGLAHICALETLDSCGVKPVAITGTSMGAIVGSWYAAGHSGALIREEVEQHIISRKDGLKEVYQKKKDLIKWLNAVRPAWGGAGLLEAEAVLNVLWDQMQVETFEELEIPLQVVAADFYRGEPFVFKTGPLMPAVQASMSIPGIFAPVEHEGRVLVDGGVVNNLPYDLLMEECDVVIAIDVNPPRDVDSTKLPSLMDITLGIFDVLVDRVTAAMIEKQPPTIYIRPSLAGTRILDFDRVEDVMEAAQPAMEELKEKLEQVMEG